MQRLLQIRALLLHLLEQTISLDNLLHGQRSRCGGRVADVGVTMLEHSATGLQRGDDLLTGQHCANGLITPA